MRTRKAAKKRARPRVPDNDVALGKMANRTPLRLTAEDEAIMREDWLLDPDKLPQVRIYQELLKFQRENQTLRAQVAERDERLEERDFAEVPVHETDGSGVARRAPPPDADPPPLYFLTAEGMREYIWLGDRWV